jgi:inosose dehydratase
MTMSRTSRRDFIKAVGIGAAAISTPAFPGQTEILRMDKLPFGLGMASYTFRAFGLAETIAMTKRLGLKRISLKSIHLPLEDSSAQIQAAAAKVREAGLDLYGGGVIYMRTEAEVRQAFAYAKAAGMRMIIGVPNHELLPLADACVRDYGIMLAIHNHGPADKIYPTPESAYEKVQSLDRRLGLCLDVGHAQRCGIDPSVPAEKYKERLLDIHIKDVNAATEKGETVEIGRGVIDIPKFLRTLVRTGYRGAASLEHEKDEKDPLPGAAESLGYVRGVLSSL